MWAEFITDDPKAWMMRIGEHNMFKDQGTHVDVNPVKIIFHPDRNRKQNMLTINIPEMCVCMVCVSVWVI